VKSPVNWNAGGTSSVSGLLKQKFNRAYNTDTTNGQTINYALRPQQTRWIELRKTDDVLL
jgi:hypothetical protein